MTDKDFAELYYQCGTLVNNKEWTKLFKIYKVMVRKGIIPELYFDEEMWEEDNGRGYRDYFNTEDLEKYDTHEAVRFGWFFMRSYIDWKMGRDVFIIEMGYGLIEPEYDTNVSSENTTFHKVKMKINTFLKKIINIKNK
jgi:hypothetical protein